MTAPGRRPRRLISIAHSYCVALNRRLAHEMARAGGDRWEVTAVAPAFIRGDLRPIPLERLDDEPCRLEVVRARLSRKVQLMTYGRRLRRLLRGEPWDLVHCWEEPFTLAAWQVARWTKRPSPMVFWTAQNLAKRYPPPFAQVERFVLDRSAGWLACGHSVVEALGPRGYARKPHIVTGMGVDPERFRPDPEAGARVRRALGWDGAGPPVVGYLGRFIPDKGVDLLMRALDDVRAPWRALFVGGGPLEAELRRWGERHGGRVAVATGVKHDDVPAHLSAMDLLCAPSQTLPRWKEQFGRMLVEAFACGVPVAASDSGEIPHVVADAGRVVGESDLPGWVAALGELLESPGLRDEYRRRGLERLRAHYTWPVIARRHLEFFDRLIDGGP
jgi:glycosyltransferase involved in cell wall biosynthesis